MNNKALILLVCMIACGGTFVLGVKLGKDSGRDNDLRTGRITGMNEVMNKLIEAFPDKISFEDEKNAKVIFTVKTSTAYLIKQNNIDTIKIAY